MAQLTWHYLTNQFDTVTEGSNKLMQTIAADHNARLVAQQSNPQISPLITRWTPFYNDFNTKYSNWVSASAVYKGISAEVKQNMAAVGKTKSKQWDVQIQVVFAEGTPEYLALLPNGRKPFYQGSIEQRIIQVRAFGERLTAYPQFAATKTDVDSFYTMLINSRDLQQQKEQLVDEASTALEAARKALALTMFFNLINLMNIFIDDLSKVEDFWELSLFRESSSGTPSPTPPPPVAIAITATTDQTVLQDIAITMQSSTASGGEEVLIKWGDGNENLVQLSNAAQISYQHTYATAGIYNLMLTGQIDRIGIFSVIGNKFTALAFPAEANQITTMRVNNNQLTEFVIPAALSQLTFLDAAANNLNTGNINNILKTINDFGTFNGTLMLNGGTNASPTGAGNAAKNALIARGWAVVTN